MIKILKAWRVKSLVDVFRLNLDIIRKRFKIYGFFNIVSLLLVLSLIFGGVKFGQSVLGYYEKVNLIILNMVYILFSKYIFPTNFKNNVERVKTYFNLISLDDIKKYYTYKNLIIFYAISIFLMFPTQISDGGEFIVYFLVLNILLFIQIKFKKKLDSNKYISIMTMIYVCLSGILILYMRGFIEFSFSKVMNPYILSCFFVLSLYLMKQNFKYIGNDEKVKQVMYFIKLSNKILKVWPNRDLVLAIRKNLFMDPIVLILISNIFLKGVTNTTEDMYYSCILSIVCSFIAIYIELINNEKASVSVFYNSVNYKDLKIHKLKSTIYMQLITLVLVTIPLMFFIPMDILFKSYMVSIIVVVLTIYLVKISLERNMDFKNILSDKDVIKLYIISTILSIVFISILC